MNRLPLTLLLSLICWANGIAAQHLRLPGGSARIGIHADTVTIIPDGNTLEAKGHVRLDAGQLKISASKLTLRLRENAAVLVDPTVLGYPNMEIAGDRLILQYKGEPTDRLKIDRPRLHLTSPWQVTGATAVCGAQACTLWRGTGTGCPHTPWGYQLRAERVLIHPSGDLDLRKPVLIIGKTPIAALPWIRLRPPNTAGFLVPHVGWDATGGLVVGPAGQLPLGSNTFAQGHIAARTAQGFETRSRLLSPWGTVTIDHLTDMPDHHIRFRGTTFTNLNRASVSSQVDLASHRQMIDDMATEPLDRTTTHLMSAALVSSAHKGVLLETHGALIQNYDGIDTDAQGSVVPTVSIGFHIPSVPVGQYLWPGLDMELRRHGIPGQRPLTDGFSSSPIPGHSRFKASPTVLIPGSIGPIRASARIGSNHSLWLMDSSSDAPFKSHSMFATTGFSLPLVRSFDRYSHSVKPFVRYQVTPWISGTSPAWVLDDFDFQTRGHGLDLGVETTIQRFVSAGKAKLALSQRLNLPGFGSGFAPAFLAGRLSAGSHLCEVVFDGSWDYAKGRPSALSALLSSAPGDGNRFSLGARWLGPGQGPHRDPLFRDTTHVPMMGPWPEDQEGRVEVTAQLDVALTRQLAANGGTRVGAWPAGILHLVWYGLSFRSRCGCLTVGIAASHRLSSPIPDVMTTFALSGL